MAAIIGSILSGVAFGLLLNVFYSALRHAWPQNYFGLSGSVDPIVSRNALRYIIFRFAPPFIAVVASSLTAERFEGAPAVAGAVTIAAHCARLIPAIISAGRRSRRRLAVTTAVIGVVLVALAFLGIEIRAVFVDIIPRPSELVANIWAGFLAAIGAVYLQGVVLVRKNPASLAKRSLEEIPLDLGRLAVVRARQRGHDERIPLAVIVAENMQRPPWFRRLEYCLPGFVNPTTGLMQQKGARDDRQSVEQGLNLVLDLMDVPPPVDRLGYTLDYEWRAKVFRGLNDGDEFYAIAEGAYQLFDDDPQLIRRFEPQSSSSP